MFAEDGAGALFVYGTLLPGEELWAVLVRFALKVSETVVSGRLFDTGLGYPAAVFDESTSVVPGVRVTVAPDQWIELVDLLDQIEDEGILFHRRQVETTAGPAMSYEWIGQTQGLRRLSDGWRGR